MQPLSTPWLYTLCDLWLWRQKDPKQWTISDHPEANADTCQGLLCKAETAQVSKGLLTPSTTWDRRVGPGSREVAFSSIVSEWINPSGPEKLTWGQLWCLSICGTVSYGPTSSWDPLTSAVPSASSVLGLSKLIMAVSASVAQFGCLCSPD